jgi:threonine aldolase
MAQRYVDLRSDTVTRPTPAMRRAMAEAEVGDDQYGEDPTVNRLEELAAEMLGKEAAVFVSSGTQGNLCAVLAHCGRGQEVIMGDQCHIVLYEQGGTATLGGLPWRVLPNTPQGTLEPAAIEAAIRGDREGEPATGVLCVENTQNRCGGLALSRETIKSMADVAHAHGVPVHMDGARVFNAAAALGVPVSEVVQDVDSVQFCLSKGLAAPVGSMIAGSTEFIGKARRMRRVVGGAMRQAGVIAAAGVVALTEMVDRLPEDHRRARKLAEGLADTPGIFVDLDLVQSNMVFYKLDPPNPEFQAEMKAQGVLVGGGQYGGRMVTHYEITDEDIDATLMAARKTVTALAR